MNPLHCLYAFLVAIVSGAMNSVAGGGTLLSFPVLVWGCGLNEKIANATSTVGLLPASVTGALGFRHGAGSAARFSIPFYAVSLLGGLAGSLLLNYTSPEKFKAILPWLILMAAVIFLLHDTISRYIFKAPPAENPTADDPHRPLPLKALFFQFFVAVYGGYFGAGIGIMMLAALSLMRVGDIYRMNFLKNLAAVAINGISAVVFIFYGLVVWPIALSMTLGALLGGWSGAGIAKKIGPKWARRMVSVVGFGIALFMIYEQIIGS